MKNFSRVFIIIVITMINVILFFSCGDSGGGGGTGGGVNSKLELTQVSAINLETWAGQTAVISFTASAVGEYYYIVRRSYDSTPTSDNILNQTTSSYNIDMGTGTVISGNNEIKISGLTAGSTNYIAYLLAKNQSNTTKVTESEPFKTIAKLRVNWTVVDKSADLGTSPQIRDAIFAEGKFFAISLSKLFSSEDGLAWTSQNISGLGVTGNAYGITYGNGIIMILVGANTILYSEDGGATWEKGGNPFEGVSIDTYNYPNFIKFAGGKFIISLTDPRSGSLDIPSTIYISQSVDGKTWSYVSKGGYTVGNNIQFYDIAYGNGKYIALSAKGWIVSNDNFETTDWTEHTYTWGSRATYNILFDDTVNRFIAAIGETPYIFSDDGSSVRYRSLSTISEAECLVKADGAYVVGTESFREIWYSSDGESWSTYTITALDSFANTNLLLYGNGKFIIILSDGKIVYNE